MRLESQMLNETFNNAPVEQEPEDNDTIAYTVTHKTESMFGTFGLFIE